MLDIDHSPRHVLHPDHAAFYSLDGLRRIAGVNGSLGQVLERMLYPETAHKLETYFKQEPIP